MQEYHRDNEYIKHQYFKELREAEQKAESTISGVRKAIARYEEFTGWKDFKTFNSDKAAAFKNHLLENKGEDGKKLSIPTTHRTLKVLQEFFRWLYSQHGYRSRITVTDIRYFNLSAKDVRIAHMNRRKIWPSPEQIAKVVKSMPTNTDIERRNQAVIAFAFVSGVRNSALVSLKLKHVDIENGVIMQYADEVKTKFSDTHITGFFPVDSYFHDIVKEWVRYLLEDKLYSPNDALFPKTHMALDENNSFQPDGISHEHWKNTTPVRDIFRESFEAADLPYFKPHAIRDTLAEMGLRKCRNNIEALKAWSQNLNHKGMLTTLTSYGQIDPNRQCELLRETANPDNSQDMLAAIKQLLAGAG